MEWMSHSGSCLTGHHPRLQRGLEPVREARSGGGACTAARRLFSPLFLGSSRRLCRVWAEPDPYEPIDKPASFCSPSRPPLVPQPQYSRNPQLWSCLVLWPHCQDTLVATRQFALQTRDTSPPGTRSHADLPCGAAPHASIHGLSISRYLQRSAASHWPIRHC